MINKRFTQYGVRFLFIAMVCSVPVVPVYPMDNPDTVEHVAPAGQDAESAPKNHENPKKKKKSEGESFWESLKKSWKSFKKSAKKTTKKAKRKIKKEYEKHPVEYTVAGSLVGLCLLYFTVKYRVKLLPWLFGPALALNKNIMIGKAKCKGDEVRFTNNVMVKQIKVKSQSGYTCGYHAFMGTCHVANEIVNGSGDLQKKLSGSHYVDKFIGDEEKPGIWRQTVINNRKEFNDGVFAGACAAGSERVAGMQNEDGEDLVYDEMQHMINNELANRQLLNRDAHCEFYVIDPRRSDDLGMQQLDFCRQRLHRAQGRTCLIGLIVNLGNAHWIGDLVYKNDKDEVAHFITDSMNWATLNSKSVRKVVKAVGSKEDWN